MILLDSAQFSIIVTVMMTYMIMCQKNTKKKYGNLTQIIYNKGVTYFIAINILNINENILKINLHNIFFEQITFNYFLFVNLNEIASFSQGGTGHDVTDIVHEEHKRIAILAAKTLGLTLCGVDIISTDISADPVSAGSNIIELNTSPGVRMHYKPDVGSPQKVAIPILTKIIETL